MLEYIGTRAVSALLLLNDNYGNKMTLKLNKIYQSLLTSFCAASLAACGGGGGSGGHDDPVDPDVVAYEISNLNGGFYNNSLYCNRSTEDRAEKLCGLRIYQVMVEAFDNGDDSINYDTGYGTSSHKGDIQGVIDRLDYIKSLGVNAVWLTPVFQSALLTDHVTPLDATGYFGQDYFKVDPHFGDENTLETLVEEAHKRGLYVFLDGVFGHFKDSIQRVSPNGHALNQTETCLNAGGTYKAGAGTLCANYNVPGSTGTQDFFRDVAVHYVKNFKIDGWRLDQAYQVPVADWNDFRTAVEEASATVSYSLDGQKVSPLGYMVGEIWSSNAVMTEKGYGTEKLPGLKSNFNFNVRYALTQALAVEESGAGNHTGTVIRAQIKDNEKAFPAFAMPNNFLGNHDLVRFGDLIQRAKKLNSIKEEKYWNRYALAHMATAVLSGPMTVYYGDEWGQEVPDFDVKRDEMGYYEDHVARTDGKFSGFTAEQDGLRQMFSKLMEYRGRLKSLYMGSMTDIKTDDVLFSVKKDYEDESVYFFMNVREDKIADIRLDTAITGAGEALYDLRTCEELPAEGNAFPIRLEPLSAIMLGNSSVYGKVCND